MVWLSGLTDGTVRGCICCVCHQRLRVSVYWAITQGMLQRLLCFFQSVYIVSCGTCGLARRRWPQHDIIKLGESSCVGLFLPEYWQLVTLADWSDFLATIGWLTAAERPCYLLGVCPVWTPFHWTIYIYFGLMLLVKIIHYYTLFYYK